MCNSAAHSQHSMQHNLMAFFFSLSPPFVRAMLLGTFGPERERSRRRCRLQLTKGPTKHPVSSTPTHARAHTSGFAGSQTVCFDPCVAPVMNKKSGCGSRSEAPQSQRLFPRADLRGQPTPKAPQRDHRGDTRRRRTKRAALPN